MTVNYIAEASYAKTVWFKETLSGIEEKCGLLKYKLQCITELDNSVNASVLIIIGTSPTWVSKTVDICNTLGITPLVVSCHPFNQSIHSSYVLINHDDATRQCIDYLKECGRESIALYGVNTDSYADMIKKNYFEAEDAYYIGSENKLKSCFDKFIKSYQKYNAVICTNYISAAHLLSELKKLNIQVPENMYVICYGDSIIGRTVTPSVTNITLDHKLLGMQAVQIYRYIYKSTDKIAVTVSVPCKIIPAESTENKPYNKGTETDNYSDADDFSNDNDIILIQNLEKLLRETDEIDLKIIDLSIEKHSVPQIADKLYVSDSSIKYRIKKMLATSEFESFLQLLEVYKKYIN